MKFLFTILVTLFLTSCATFDAGKTADRINDATKATTSLCNVAQQLSSAGIDVPCVEHCEKILPMLTGEELVVIADVLKCADMYGFDTVYFAHCAVDVGGRPVLKRVKELAEK
jgi:hypothetical protein